MKIKNLIQFFGIKFYVNVPLEPWNETLVVNTIVEPLLI